jgi:hypothetical protein
MPRTESITAALLAISTLLREIRMWRPPMDVIEKLAIALVISVLKAAVRNPSHYAEVKHLICEIAALADEAATALDCQQN